MLEESVAATASYLDARYCIHYGGKCINKDSAHTLARMSSREIHRKVKDAVRELSKETEYVCVNVESIAEKAKIDTRTVKLHLELLEEDGFGKFCDPKRKTFSTIKDTSTK